MTAKAAIIRRCAVYTRKSSEEGLEQDFNSLHAQRESCEAFIRSQRAEGWRLIETAYDDGGLSGGTLERPALQHLLTDIRERRVDTVVVYKVDRLTRSLMDFAKIVELFDRHGVTFVAITQQFNTTTSMGRLTLNILLSFAQFEREVIGERVRDKIAASKKKGMWMGGVAPLGYEVTDRKLTVIPEEAATVRLIFRRYLELGSVRLLKQDLEQTGIRSKQRVQRDGSRIGGQPFSRGALYTLLSNPIYIGEIAHKKARYAGQHAAILDRKIWDEVQKRLRSRTPERTRTPVSSDSPLLWQAL
jgi:site-specific DNA recombinase